MGWRLIKCNRGKDTAKYPPFFHPLSLSFIPPSRFVSPPLRYPSLLFPFSSFFSFFLLFFFWSLESPFRDGTLWELPFSSPLSSRVGSGRMEILVLLASWNISLGLFFFLFWRGSVEIEEFFVLNEARFLNDSGNKQDSREKRLFRPGGEVLFFQWGLFRIVNLFFSSFEVYFCIYVFFLKECALFRYDYYIFAKNFFYLNVK